EGNHGGQVVDQVNTMEDEEQPAPSTIEEGQLEEIKLELKPLDEESIIEFCLLSFEGPDLINESMMEESYQEDLVVPNSPLE
ncbi:hypothetical protein KI387_028781, partial [Taxus chinensis]